MPVSKDVRTSIMMGVASVIIANLLPWLEEEAKKTETPIDDNMVKMLKVALGLGI